MVIRIDAIVQNEMFFSGLKNVIIRDLIFQGTINLWVDLDGTAKVSGSVFKFSLIIGVKDVNQECLELEM
jgi:hypothetical protein